jgi:D,D-heptose 1,7-bisphosphate phosphatase
MTNAALFIDRDGTINEDIGYVSTPEDLIIYPWAAEAIRLVNESGMKVIVITNQSGVARGLYTEETLHSIHGRRAPAGCDCAQLDGIYYCPHHQDRRRSLQANLRLPQARSGMLYQAAREHDVDLTRSSLSETSRAT